MDSERFWAAARRLRCSPAEALALAVLAGGGLAVLGLLWLLAGGRGSETATVAPAGLVVESAAPAPAPTELVVHVAGRVAAPGVLRVPDGSRVGDAIAAAGGALGDAALDQLNLARPLADGEQILVPGPGVALPPAAAGSAPGRPDGLVDLNLATAEDLDELPGVGPVLAERILAHRAAIGRFSSVEELRDVQGIGDATFRDLEPAVTV